jgi:ribosomal protein L37AE/L43A
METRISLFEIVTHWQKMIIQKHRLVKKTIQNYTLDVYNTLISTNFVLSEVATMSTDIESELKCTKCGSTNLQSIGSSSTEVGYAPWTDVAGFKHYHNKNRAREHFQCKDCNFRSYFDQVTRPIYHSCKCGWSQHPSYTAKEAGEKEDCSHQ